MPTQPSRSESARCGNRRVADAVREIGERLLSRGTCLVPEPSEEQERAGRAERRWRSLIESIGRRYESCRLTTFERLSGKGTPPEDRGRQETALETLTRLASHVREHVQSGGNLILYGPPGTGKDHLLVALLRVAIMADLSAEWINGQDLFGEFRDRIDTDLSEERAVRKFCRADVLAISDPLPPRGSVSDYGATMLYRVIDRRYRGLRATWTTVNVADAAEAARELTGPIFDRLADNCVAVFCNWPSYRRTRRPAWLHTK